MFDATLNLKLTHFRLISAVAEHGQLQLAASTLAITQPAASRMLGEIERIVGLPLFDRNPRGMVPTEMGRILVHRAQAMTVGMQDLTREVQDLRHGRGGSLRVGSVTGPAVGCLVPALRKLKANAPDVQVAIEVAPSARLVQGLLGGEFDFIISRLPPDMSRADFAMHAAGVEVVKFLAHRDHPLAGAKKVPLTALGGYEWIIQDQGSPIRQAVEEELARIGALRPPGVVTTSSLILMLALLGGSTAVAPMAEEVATLVDTTTDNGRYTVLNVEGAIVLPHYYIIEAQGRMLSAVAQRLRTLVMAELAETYAIE
ncbi:LysR family transcriptional regulator [Falsirhodobacter sp. alg1]|uniref:LysR family transcriptional regulator n=1 Tax=Falsirhodobacter sp. alg1 TaxID=1472418 RepID=UPI0005F0407D|nr:LysR family transcriptional regulator [Falsirhodobacter sp. alg1]